MGETRNAYKILVGKSQGRNIVEDLGFRWEDSFRMNLGEIGQKIVDCIHLAQYRDPWKAVVNMVMNFWVP
jgi:hypothetical protein